MKEEINLKIRNFKTILLEQDFKIFNLNSNVLIGLNGAGKSNILKSLNYLQNKDSETEDTYKPHIDEENINSKYKNIYNLGTIIILEIPLLSEQIKNIDVKLKEIGISDSFEKIFNNQKLIKKVSNINNYEFIKKNGILFSLIKYIFSNRKEIIEKYIYDFFPKFKEDNFLPLIEDRTKIFNALKKSEKNGENSIVKIFKFLYWIIDEIFNNNIDVVYIEDANSTNTKHIYQLRNFFEIQNVDLNQKNEIKEMFNFFDYDKSFELESKFKDYYFNSDYNSDKAINLKSSIEKKINKKLDEIFKNFSIYAKFVFEISNKTFRIDFRNKNEKFFIEDKNPQNSSSGFNSFFQIIFKTNIYKNQDFNNPILFLFDEPEKNLYLKLQVELLKYMKKIMQDNNNLYILFSTHSPYMIDSKNQNIIHIERDEYGSSKIRNLTNFKDNSLSGESRKLIQDSLTLSDANQKLKKEEILKTKVIRYHSKLKKNNKFISQILESEEIKLKFDLIEDDKNRDNSIAILDFTKNGESVISLINDYYIDLSDNESIDIYMK